MGNTESEAEAQNDNGRATQEATPRNTTEGTPQNEKPTLQKQTNPPGFDNPVAPVKDTSTTDNPVYGDARGTKASPIDSGITDSIAQNPAIGNGVAPAADNGGPTGPGGSRSLNETASPTNPASSLPIKPTALAKLQQTETMMRFNMAQQTDSRTVAAKLQQTDPEPKPLREPEKPPTVMHFNPSLIVSASMDQPQYRARQPTTWTVDLNDLKEAQSRLEKPNVYVLPSNSYSHAYRPRNVAAERENNVYEFGSNWNVPIQHQQQLPNGFLQSRAVSAQKEDIFVVQVPKAGEPFHDELRRHSWQGNPLRETNAMKQPFVVLGGTQAFDSGNAIVYDTWWDST